MKPEPKPYEWDWDGAWDPATSSHHSNNTFSVGVFQWLPKASGKGLKRGKVVRRIQGYTSQPEVVYQKAREECARRNMEESH